MERTQEEKLLAGLTHVVVFFFPIGFIINIVLYIVYREKSTFVARHIRQAIGIQLEWLLVNVVLGSALGVSFASFVISIARLGTLPWSSFGSMLLFALVMGAVAIAFLVMIVLAAIKGFQGEEHRYPIIGEFVDGLNI